MDTTDVRIPNPEEVERDYIDVPYERSWRVDADGYWEPVYGFQRYVKFELASDYVVWVLDGEHNH